MITFYNKYKFQFQLFLIYLICHGGLFLILNSVYWDDWTLINTNKNIIFSTFKQAGGAFFNFTAILHTSIIPFGIWIYRVLTFILFYLSGILLYSILLKSNRINNNTCKFVVLFFLILPFNSARVALIDFPYTIGYFLFFLAWNFKKYKFFSLPVFFFSFLINSLPFLYVLVLIDLYFEKYNNFNFLFLKTFFIRKIDYILLPCLFFYIKYKYFITSGLYKTYNSSFEIKNLFLSPIRQMRDFTELNVNVFSLIFIFFFLIKFKPFNEVVSGVKFDKIIFSLIALFLSVFPYWILGLTPTFFEWSSRHQLLMPFPIALLIVFFISKLNINSRYFFFSILISLVVLINVSNYIMFFRDWNKQKELISIIKKNTSLENKKLIFIVDNTKEYNALARSYRFYEWNGLFKYAYKNENRFVLNFTDVELYKNGVFDDYFNEYGNAKGFKKIDPKSATIVNIYKVEPRTYVEKIKYIFFPMLYITYK
jgi:hypothetical protein